MIFRVCTFLLSALFFLASGCGLEEELLGTQSPREDYLQNLRKAELVNSTMAAQWIDAGESALHDTMITQLPSEIHYYFHPAKPSASAILMDLDRGQELHVKIAKLPDTMNLFIDLFSIRREEGVVEEITGVEKDSFIIDINEDGHYLLRLQPPLLEGGRVVIKLLIRPVFSNPVDNAGNRDIGSFFGDPRDGGRRKHHGIDIFQKRGTPVLSPSQGRVTRVREGGRGGKSVWVNDRNRNLRLYFAHLDSQYVRVGQHVFPGDTLGFVGNTGNARTTPPHLHFGLYSSSGPIDPLPYVFVEPTEISPLRGDTSVLGHVGKISARSLSLLEDPNSNSKKLATLRHGQLVLIENARGSHYQVATLLGQKGFVASNYVDVANSSISQKVNPDTSLLFWNADSTSIPIDVILPGESLSILGTGDNKTFVESADGKRGWVFHHFSGN